MSPDIYQLKKSLAGKLLLPGDDDYITASQAWNLAVKQTPAIVVMAETTEDIQRSIKFAAKFNMGVGVMCTGHGVGSFCDNGLLINTSLMRKVEIDVQQQQASVEAGVLWKDVITAASAYGLTGLAGSASHVGVVGYTVGGGFGYLGRKYGLNSANVISANIVCADGALFEVSATENTELFWAIRGGTGNFGIIASLTFRLFPVSEVFGGAVFYPAALSKEILEDFVHWSETIPDELTAALTFMKLPSLSFIPVALQGKAVVAIKGCYCGRDFENAGPKIFDKMRKNFGEPLLDTFRPMPVTEMDTISSDPVNPAAILQYGGLLKELSAEAIDLYAGIFSDSRNSGLRMLEFRKLGGALNKNSEDIKLLGNSGARFSVNMIGIEAEDQTNSTSSFYFDDIAAASRQYETGEIFINYMEASPSGNRVRAAYTPGDLAKLGGLKEKYDPENMFRFNRNITASSF